MIYNLENLLDKNQAIEKMKFFIEKKKRIELTVKNPKRSISQNSYLHLILSWFGVETGYTLKEVKEEIFKKHVNPALFYDGQKEKIHGIITEHWRSTSNLDTAEMTLAIDRFRNFASKELGIYLPEPKDLDSIQQMENELSKRKNQEHL